MMTADECQTWRRYFLPSTKSVIIFFELPVKSSTCTMVTAANGTAGVHINDAELWVNTLCCVQCKPTYLSLQNFTKRKNFKFPMKKKVGLVFTAARLHYNKSHKITNL